MPLGYDRYFNQVILEGQDHAVLGDFRDRHAIYVVADQQSSAIGDDCPQARVVRLDVS